MNVVINLSQRKVSFHRETSKRPVSKRKIAAFAVAVATGALMSVQLTGGVHLTHVQDFAVNAAFALSFYVLMQKRRAAKAGQPVAVAN